MQVFKRNLKISKQTKKPIEKNSPIIQNEKKGRIIFKKFKINSFKDTNKKPFLNAFDKIKQKDIDQINLKIEKLQKDLDEKNNFLKILKLESEKKQQEINLRGRLIEE